MEPAALGSHDKDRRWTMHVSDQGGLLRARGGGEERVTPLELFFDLVFVFALTQVTGFLVDHLTWLGMLQAAALLMVLWSHRGRVTRGLPTPYQLRR
jgi:low temperature requirement protein LtrA